MGIFDWFTRNRGLGKITKVAVLVAALSTACQSKSEKFVQLVEPKDRAVATQLINNPQKEKDWKKAVGALEQLYSILNQMAYDKRSGYKYVGIDIPHFYLVSYLEKVINSYKKSVEKDLTILRSIGLAETSDLLEKEFQKGLIDLDLTMTKVINKSMAQLEALPKERVRVEIKTDEHIRGLQLLLKSAKNGGFRRTAEAASNALINIRGLLAK